MNRTNRMLMNLALTAAVSMPLQTLGAGPAPVALGSSAHFAILANTAVTAGGGTILGDVGLSPTAGSGITGLNPNVVRGIIYAVDAGGPAGSIVDPGLLAAAKVDLATACAEASSRTNADAVNPGAGNIGGMNLGPGLYKFTSEASIAGADVTLTGGSNDVWIFQIGSTLTVGSDGRHVILAGGAQARNIFWQVGSSATLGTSCDFKGTILANVTITMDASCTVEGRALASIGAVTFNGAHIGLPVPEAPRFTKIYATASDSLTVVLSTTPYYILTLNACPDLLLTNWTTIATDTPASNLWTFTDNAAVPAGTRRFYQAFITAYR